ncbi:MAG: hypothetical protein CL843_16495 [Crocinitomicaceae bacterium]|nr:hypothetical protein [Crocinitomicaceae bacterium]
MSNRILLFILFLFTTQVGVAQMCDCAKDMAFLVAAYNNDYAGMQDFKVKHSEYQQIVDSLVQASQGITSLQACGIRIAAYIHYLNNGHVYFGKTKEHPQYARKSHISEQPTVQIVDEQQVVVSIPSADLYLKPVLDSLIDIYSSQIMQHNLLIIDLRGNGGGGDAMFHALLPFIYTNPIYTHGTELWTSANNVQLFRDLLSNPHLPEADKKDIQRIVKKTEKHPNQFILLSENRVDTLTLDTVLPYPQKVSILIDKGCKSATEQFLLKAQQSEKVTLYGTENSGGALDYANLNTVILPSGYWYVSLPTTRTTRLPNNPVDPDGIAPDVKVAKGTDVLEFVLTH